MKNNTLQNSYKKYLASIGSSPASSRTADAINQHLPENMHVSRMTTSNWMSKGTADPGTFAMLMLVAPNESEEYSFARHALIALGCLVEDEEKPVS
jgi:hypothetical protein